MELMVAGMAPKKIAERLHLSPRTVSTYRTRLLRNLGLNGNAQLIHYAMQNNLFA